MVITVLAPIIPLQRKKTQAVTAAEETTIRHRTGPILPLVGRSFVLSGGPAWQP